MTAISNLSYDANQHANSDYLAPSLTCVAFFSPKGALHCTKDQQNETQATFQKPHVDTFERLWTHLDTWGHF